MLVNLFINDMSSAGLVLLLFCLLQSENAFSVTEKSFNASSGTIKPELKEGHYLNNMDTIYNVKVPNGKRAKLSFSSFLVSGIMPSCTQDSLEIFVGCQKKSVGKFCSGGGFKPFDIYSMDQCITLHFKTDGSNTGTGFEAVYTSVDKDTSFSNNEACSNLSQNASGNFFSPLWPNNYPNTTLCTWKLSIPDGYKSRIYFMNFRIEDNSQCNPLSRIDDYVGITAFNGTANVIVKQRLCSTYADKTFTVDIDEYPIVYVTLFTDNDNVAASGFAAGFMSYKISNESYTKSTSVTPTDGTDLPTVTDVLPTVTDTPPKGTDVLPTVTDTPPKGDASGLSSNISMVMVAMAFVFSVLLNECTK